MSNHAKRRIRPVLVLALPLVILAAALAASCKYDGQGSITNQHATLGTKGLWIANGTNVLEYVPNQMIGGTANVGPLVVSSGAFGSPQGVQFDANGNLWVLDSAAMVNGVATAAVLGFSASQVGALATSNAPEPVTVITSTALKLPQQSVFDSQGDQWITDHDNNTILVFTAAQLGQTGLNISPAVIISSTALNGPTGVAFDGAGNLWVANDGDVPQSSGGTSSAGTTIVEFAAAKLPTPPTTGMLTPDLAPDITLNDDGDSSIQGPWALAFDADGNLWSSNAVSATVVEFAKSSLATSGKPTPAAILSSTTVSGNAALDAPHGLCFDDQGNLVAVSSAGPFAVALFAKSQLATGAPTPDTLFIGSATGLSAPQGCVFGPAIM
ncbi:MAG TPA: hypothetical protein VFB37_05675 [Steroidobacteraceae bacterium]|nr:hypothetical protein [Steroidobacteraceae bacterium]